MIELHAGMHAEPRVHGDLDTSPGSIGFPAFGPLAQAIGPVYCVVVAGGWHTTACNGG